MATEASLIRGVSAPAPSLRYLVFGGKTGWVGQMLCKLLEKDANVVFKIATSRLENREAVERELDEFCPTHVLNSSGRRGYPNVSWCETNKVETLRIR